MQPKCPLADEWIKKMWYIYTMGYYSAISKPLSLKGVKESGQCYWNLVRVGSCWKRATWQEMWPQVDEFAPICQTAPWRLGINILNSHFSHTPNSCMCLPLAEPNRIRRLVSLNDSAHWDAHSRAECRAERRMVLRRRTLGIQKWVWLGIWDWQVHTTIFKIDNQQEPTV